MKLYAISDLHLDYEQNREALTELGQYEHDWLILAGDIGHRIDHYHYAFEQLSRRFAKLIWVPGNHDLWTAPGESHALRGEDRYFQLVECCREYHVVTPEDDYPLFSLPSSQNLIVPLFLLYDYTFRPDSVSAEGALAWAKEQGIVCADEYYLHADPYPSRQSWCHQRCAVSEQRIETSLANTNDASPILINHWPLNQALACLPRVPRFTLWCGTRTTNDWHTRFRAHTVVYGHLHIRRSLVMDGVRFEEVSLGYPRNWDRSRGIRHYLRQILPT